MFTNYNSKEECYNFIYSMRFVSNDGKHFYPADFADYKYRPNEYSPRQYVVKYRKTVNGNRQYGVYVSTYYYDVCRPDGCCHGRDRSRFLTSEDIRGFYYGEMSSGLSDGR